MTEERDAGILPRDASRPRFKHVILTRFNVRYVEDPNAPSIGVDPSWLADRFALFERYCLPSVLDQSEPDFSWILFFDSQTPEPYAERARALASLRPGFFPVFRDSLPMAEILKIVQGVLPEQPEWLLTSRFDNDDGLHRDFVGTVQRAQRFDQAEVLNCPTGIILRGAQTYKRRDPSNAFISLSEPFQGMKTVFSIIRHVYARESYPVRQVANAPMWLQVIHESNISNRVRGWRVPYASAAAQFACLAALDAPKQEDRLKILAENLTLSVIRKSRDVAVIIVRRVAKLFGVDIRRKAARGAQKQTATQ